MGRPFYFYHLFTDSEHRGSRLKEGLRAVAKVFTLAVILDILFQLFVFKWFYPGEAILVAFLLAFSALLTGAWSSKPARSQFHVQTFAK